MALAHRTQQPRIWAVDWARSAALAAMAAFHFGVDLELFGHLAPGTTRGLGWRLGAQSIAGSFLFLAGISLWLAHGQGIHWRSFLRRLGVLVLAAGAVSLATWFAMPQQFVHFGILHSIAAASVIGLAALRLPVWALLALAAVIYAAPLFYRDPAFDAPWLWWVGFSTAPPPSMDYEPVFPWLAPCLAGIAFGKWGTSTGLWERLATTTPPARAGRWLAWPGQHSLAVYLVHQPVLIALVWAGTLLFTV